MATNCTGPTNAVREYGTDRFSAQTVTLTQNAQPPYKFGANAKRRSILIFNATAAGGPTILIGPTGPSAQVASSSFPLEPQQSVTMFTVQDIYVFNPNVGTATVAFIEESDQ